MVKMDNGKSLKSDDDAKYSEEGKIIPEGEEKKSEDTPVLKGGYIVDGVRKSITTKQGIKVSGQEVKASYFVGGIKDLESLIRIGLVKKV